MDTLYIALLILILIGIAGLGWFSFVLYKKQRRNSEKVIREVYKLFMKLLVEQNHH